MTVWIAGALVILFEKITQDKRPTCVTAAGLATPVEISWSTIFNVLPKVASMVRLRFFRQFAKDWSAPKAKTVKTGADPT